MGGSVQRFEFTLGEPVRVERAVELNDPDLVEPDLDWDGALRNTTIDEYYSEDATSYQIVFDMMHYIQSARLHPTCWVTGADEEGLLDLWFEFKERGMTSGVGEMFAGKPLRRLKSIPEDTLILCGSRYQDADPDEISLAVKTAIELRRPHDSSRSEVDDSGRVDTGERSAAARQLALAGGGLREVEWKGTGDPGE
jgi:hypothetical protein